MQFVSCLDLDEYGIRKIMVLFLLHLYYHSGDVPSFDLSLLGLLKIKMQSQKEAEQKLPFMYIGCYTSCSLRML